MIPLNFQTWVLVYLFLLLSFFLGLWLYHHYKQRKKPRLPALHDLTICEYCHFPYLALTTKPISKCPQCQSFNANLRK